MRYVQHKSNTRVLGAPPGWDQKDLPVGALPITDTLVGEQPAIACFWKPDPQELAALNAGGLVVLQVVGYTTPPVAVGVTEDV